MQFAAALRIYHWGRTAVQRDALAKHHYSELRAKGYPHGRALRGLLKVAVAMLKANTPDCGNSLDTPVEADESQELTYVDIDTFLESF